MDHVVGDDDLLAGFELLEDGFLLVGAEGDQAVLEAGLDLLAGDNFFESFSVFLDGEDARGGGGEDEGGAVADS